MRHRSTLLVVVALVLAAAGCGGGGSKSAATTATPATTAATTTSQTTTEAQTTTAGTNAFGFATAANCRQLADLGTKYSEALSGASSSGDLKKVAQLLKDFAAKTPGSIRPEFKILADDYAKIADAVGNLKPGTTPSADTLAKLQKLSTEIDTTRLAQASTRISAWLQKNCAP